MNARGETNAISMEFDLPHPAAKVWRALTEPELLAKWLMTTDMQPIVGKNFTFRMQLPPGAPAQGWDGIVKCEVKELELHKRIGYTWGGGGLDTMVTWTLTPTPTGGTLLRLEHSGFRPEEGQQRYFVGARMGWQQNAGQRLPDVLAQIA